MDEVESLKKEIEKIKQRNSRVEMAKAWETSWVRRVSIVVLTYLVMVLVFTVIHVDNPYVNAIIPTLGYFLSTLSIGAVREWWIKKNADQKLK